MSALAAFAARTSEKRAAGVREKETLLALAAGLDDVLARCLDLADGDAAAYARYAGLRKKAGRTGETDDGELRAAARRVMEIPV